MASAKMAVRTRTAMIRKPATTFLLSSSRFTTAGLRTVRVAAVAAGLCITDPRGDQPVAEVDEQVHNGEDDAEHAHGTLNHRGIGLTDAVDDQPADAGPGEHVFDHDGTAEQ